MSAPLGSIKTWSDVQLMEDINDEDSVSAAKYNKRQRRAKARKEEAEQRAREEAEQIAWEEAEQRACEEQWRVEAERRKAEEQAKKHISHFWLVMIELTVLGRGGRCATVRKGQGEDVRAAGVQLVHGAWAQVRTQAW